MNLIETPKRERKMKLMQSWKLAKIRKLRLQCPFLNDHCSLVLSTRTNCVDHIISSLEIQTINSTMESTQDSTQSRGKVFLFWPYTYGILSVVATINLNRINGSQTTQAVVSPISKWFNPNVHYEYHAGTMGHPTENCNDFKIRVQEMIDNG